MALQLIHLGLMDGEKESTWDQFEEQARDYGMFSNRASFKLMPTIVRACIIQMYTVHLYAEYKSLKLDAG